MKVRELMTTELFTVGPDHKLDLIDDVMSWQHIRHIPVVDQDSNLVGLVTHRDLLTAAASSFSEFSQKEQREIFEKIIVENIMQKDICTVESEDDIRVAATKMIDRKIGCVPVLEKKALVGILTEADFLKLAWEQEK